MKTMNAKRIAAVAAGAAMIGAAFAGAVSVDSGVGSYKFFSNDEPNVRIVVGSAAQASDAVAAANIAAMVGNLAYASSAITVVGKDQVSCPATGGGACTIDPASKAVTLEVTTPSGPAGAYTMKTYIEDYLDSNPDVTRNVSTSFGGSLSKSGTNVQPSTSDFPKAISGADTTVLQRDAPVTGVRSLTVKQTEWVYTHAQTLFDDPTDSVQARTVKGAYKSVFSNPLPECLDTSKNPTTCNTGDLTKNNHVQVYFLGEKWNVVAMNSNTSTPSITLGKEAAYSPVMQIGDELTAPNGAKVKLKSISGIGYTTAYLPYASFEITDPATGTSSTKTIQTNGEEQIAGVTVHVNNIFPGVNQVNYADVSVYSDKLDLIDGQQISGHGYWRAIITNTTYGSTAAIAEVGVYSPIDQPNLKSGESLSLITNQAALKVTYGGVETVTFDPLTFTSPGVTTESLVFNSTGGTAQTNQYMTITSGRSDAFRATTPTTINTNIVKVALTPGTGAGLPSVLGSVWTTHPTEGYWVNIANTTLDYYYSSSDKATLSFIIGAVATLNGTTVRVPEFLVDNQVGTANTTTPSGVGYLEFYWSNATDNFINSGAVGASSDQGYYNNSAASLTTAKPLYITPRGSQLTSFGTSSVQYQYATSLAHARYYLEGAGATGSGTASRVAKVGDTVDLGAGYSVKVTGIDCSATGGGTCGAPTGLDALAPSAAQAVVIKALDTSASPLVITDAQASGYANVIVVGGPIVNTVAKEALGDGAITSATEAFVKVVGSKVVVAGYTAADTQAAANTLIKWLSDNRNSLVR